MHAGPEAHVVLVVEDEVFLREYVVDEFRRLGWHVLETATGEQALTFATTERVDVVFTDIQLGGQLSGWEVAEALRRREPTLPVLYTSGNASIKARQVVGSAFLSKPYEAEAAVKLCCRLLQEQD